MNYRSLADLNLLPHRIPYGAVETIPQTMNYEFEVDAGFKLDMALTIAPPSLINLRIDHRSKKILVITNKENENEQT